MGMMCYETRKRKDFFPGNVNIENNEIGKRKGSFNKYDKNGKNSIEIKDKNDNKKNKLPQVQHQPENIYPDLSKKVKKISSMYNEVLEKHNEIRKNLEIQNLKLNDKITILAQKFADNYDSSEESNFIMDKYNNQYLGINYEIFKGDISKIIEICESWIDEGIEGDKILQNYYKYTSKTKHFSQIISKNTREMGIGYSELNNEEKIFIVYYYPAGEIFK